MTNKYRKCPDCGNDLYAMYYRPKTPGITTKSTGKKYCPICNKVYGITYKTEP